MYVTIWITSVIVFLKRLGIHIDIFLLRKGVKAKGVTAHCFKEKHNQNEGEGNNDKFNKNKEEKSSLAY